MTRVTLKIMALLAWTAILVLSVYFFFDNVIAYFFGYRSPLFGDSFFHNQMWVVMHMAGGTLTLFFGPLQFWKSFRNRFLQAHRLTGYVYMAGIALAGLSALRLSLISTCVPCRVSLFLLAVLAILSTAFSWIAVRNRDLENHRKFMVRSYVCVLAFVAVRVDSIFSLDFLFGQIADETLRRVVNEYFWSFVPLIVAEVVMVWVPSIKKTKIRRAMKTNEHPAAIS